MNQIQILAIALIVNVFSLTAYGQHKSEAENEDLYIESTYETEEIYEEEYYDQEDDSYWLNQRRNELDKCDDLIIYGNQNNTNYFHIINEGKERFLYFDEVIVTSKEGELSAIYYPEIINKNNPESSREIFISLSKSFFNPEEFNCAPQVRSFGRPIQDCIELFPANLFHKNAFSQMEILKIDKDENGKISFVEFSFSFVDSDDFDNEISIKGYIKTNNIIDLSDKFRAETKDLKGDILEKDVNYLFYDEGGKAVSLFSFESYYLGNFTQFLHSEDPQIVTNKQTAEIIAIEKYHPEFIQLNYYVGSVVGYDENRIFNFANYLHPKVSNTTLTKTISVRNPSKIRSLKDFDFAMYTNNINSDKLRNQQLLPNNLPSTETLALKSMKDRSNSYCPATFEGFCISETIKNSKGSSEIFITAEENDNWTVLDDLFDDFIILQLNTPFKYWKHLENDDKTVQKKISMDYDTLLFKYKIPFESSGDFFTQLENSRGSFEKVTILTKHFGFNQVMLSSEKLRDNNQRHSGLIKKWSNNFEITKFYADYLGILETIALENLYPNDFGNSYSDIESMYETEAENYEYEEGFYEEDNYSQRENQENEIDDLNAIDETITKENNQKINNIVYNLFQKYGMEYDQNSEPETLQNLVFKNPNISERFGESSPYILRNLMQVQVSSDMAELYEHYFPNNSEPPFQPQMLKVMTKTGMPISRSFIHYETDFSIEYEGDSILLKANNLTQGSDQVKIHSPSNCYDIFSLTSIISHQKIDKSLNKTMLLFDLIPEKSRSYSYAGSVELNLENDEADLEEMVPQIRNSINARPEFFLATITFDSEGTIGNDTPFYLLKVAVSGNIRNSLFDYYTQDAAFYIQVAKSFPHYVLSIYH